MLVCVFNRLVIPVPTIIATPSFCPRIPPPLVLYDGRRETDNISFHNLAAQRQPSAGLGVSHFMAHARLLLSRRPMVHAAVRRGTFARWEIAVASLDFGTL